MYSIIWSLTILQKPKDFIWPALNNESLSVRKNFASFKESVSQVISLHFINLLYMLNINGLPENLTVPVHSITTLLYSMFEKVLLFLIIKLSILFADVTTCSVCSTKLKLESKITSKFLTLSQYWSCSHI